MNQDNFNGKSAENQGIADFDAEYLRLIKADIVQAQANLDNLPERDRRGLTLETLRHFGCGYLTDWVLTKSRAELACGLYVDENGKEKHLPPPSARIIIPTKSMEHINGVAINRLSMDKKFWKQHAGKMELFCDSAALDADLIVIVEGEMDAMSIYQATAGKVAVVAILGCGNWKKTLLPKLENLREKHLIILFDADSAGKKSAERLRTELAGRGHVVVAKYLYDAMHKADQNDFGWKVDANEILKYKGNDDLKFLIEKIIAEAAPDFARLENEKEQWRQRVRENNAHTSPELSIPTPKTKKVPASGAIEENFGDNADCKEIKLILNEYVHASDLTRNDWRDVGVILKRYGFTLDDFKKWSNDGDSRYDEDACDAIWRDFDTATGATNNPLTIATLINLAKQFGYQPKRKRADRANVFDKFNTDRLQSMRKATTNDAEPIGISDSTSPKAKRQERADRMNDLMTTREVADFIGVSRKTVENWRSRKLFGCYFFPADEKHGDTLYYKRERVEQLKSVYQFGILQNMYKLARLNPEATPPADFQKSDSSSRQDDFQKSRTSDEQNNLGEELSFRHREFMILDEVADFFGVNRKTVEKWHERGQLKEDMLGHNGDLYFAIDNVLKFTPPKERKTKPDRADVYNSPAPMDDDQTTDDGEITTKYYVKDCPAALTIPANFEFKNRGITQLIPDKKKPDEPKRVITTRTPIIPTKILREAKSGTVQYEIAIKSGDTWRKAIVSGRTINDSRAIIDLADYGALVEYPAALKSFFNSIIATNLTNGRLTSSKVYKMPGWHDGEFIYPQSTGDKIVMRDGIDYDSLFAVKGSRDAWHAKFEETCFNKGLQNSFGTNILLAQYIVGNALLAPALEILGLPNTQVHLWGARNSAKSPILKLAVSIYGNPTEGKLFRNFASTAKNRMTFAAGLCDLPLAIDELEAADKFDDLQGETYRFFGGTINQANKRDGRTREAEDFRGVRLMTGEHAFIEVDTAKGGAIKRVIQIQAKTPLMPEERAHELHLFLADNFGHYGREWTKYLAEHKREMKEAFAVLKDKIANDDATPNCEATHIRAVLGAFFCFAIFNKIFGTNYVTTDDEWILLHTRLILRELPTLDEIDVAKRAIDYLSSYVDEHPRKFLTDSTTYESQDEQKRKSEELDGIKYHDGKVAFFANAFKRVISKSGLPSYSAVLSELYEADALIAKNSREKSCLVYHPISQTRARVYLFKENILSISAKDYENEDDLP